MKKLSNYTVLIAGILCCVSFVILLRAATGGVESEYQSYFGIDQGIGAELIGIEDAETREQFLDKELNVTEMVLQEGDVLSQDFWHDAFTLDTLSFNVGTLNKSDIKVLVKDEADNTVFSQHYKIDAEISELSLDINSLRYDKKEIFTLEIEVTGNESVTVYCCAYNQAASVNDEKQEDGVLLKTEGVTKVSRIRSVGIISVFTIMLLALTIFLFRWGKTYPKKEENDLRIRAFIFEAILSILVILSFIAFYSSYRYGQNTSLIAMLIFVISTAVLIVSMIYIYLRINHIEYIFLLLVIPIGLAYVFMIMPDNIPDELVHFTKAYLTSEGVFHSASIVNVPQSYVEFGIKNYNDIWPALMKWEDYSKVYPIDSVVGYSFISYIVPGVSLFIVRILGLSIYIGYYAGRIGNLLILIITGYYCIKIMPVGKKTFLVYLLNPMMLQQACSFSADGLVNCTLALAVAYFIKLRFSNEPIERKDIIVVCGLIAVTVIMKYVYLPIFGIYFLLYPKLFAMDKKHWFMFLAGGLSVVMAVLLAKGIAGVSEKSVANQMYLKENGVDAAKQIEFLLSQPLSILKVLKQTLQVQWEFYVDSYIGFLGWLAIPINDISYRLYVTVMLGVPLFEVKKRFKAGERIWVGIVFLAVSILLIMGMYIEWTAVGTYVVQGVQGRYFIPVAMLLPLLYMGNNRLGTKNVNILIAMALGIVHLLIMKDVLLFFA